MKLLHISNWEHLEKTLRVEYSSNKLVFRGVPNVDFKLRPKVGRLVEGVRRYQLDRERGLLARFKQFAALHLTHVPLKVSPDTVMRDWRLAKARLLHELRQWVVG